MVTLRPVSAADATAIAAIYNHFVENSIVTFEEEPISVGEVKKRISEVTAKFPWIVAIEDNIPIGYAYASAWRTRISYRHSVESSVYLHPSATGRGVGGQLYTELLRLLGEQRLHVVLGGIALPNPASVALHEKLGFEKVAHLRAVGYKFSQWIDVGYWQKML